MMLAATDQTDGMRSVDVRDTTIRYLPLGAPLEGAGRHIVWAHGWGQDHRFFLPVAQPVEALGAHTLLDFPGFGRSPPPLAPWGTADYADAIADWLAPLPRRPRIWVGHSFGCRVGLQLAARHPDAVDGLFLVAAAGLKRARPPLEKLKIAARVRLFKTLRMVARLGIDVAVLRDRLGSADYRSAGPMRPILVKVIGEDLTEVARGVRCPVVLIYGALDTETPPEIGERLAALIAGAQLHVLPRLDHYTVLTEGSHQLQYQLRQFVGRATP
jgi:pimeloyl-ACP methyl ester carboxylesterase